jgi:hypothetical protein
MAHGRSTAGAARLYMGALYRSFHALLRDGRGIDCRDPDNDVIVYFHNMGKFDAHVPDRNKDRILDHINLREDMKIIDGRLVSAKVGACEIRDSWNLFPSPLREFGNKLEIDYRKLEADVRHKHMPEIKTYLAQDCVGLWNAIHGFEQQYGRHLTQAGASMAQWKKISELPAPQTDQRYFQKFQQYYYGGRVQAIRKGYIKGPLYVRDIRSAYPRAMLEAHPYSPDYFEIAYPRTVEGPDMVTLDCVSVGALPFRDTSGAITFPRDGVRRRYHVTGWEVIAATDTGSLREVDIVNLVRFSGRQDFSLYINHFYSLRQQYKAANDDANTYFAKILMNSLYGKFGANPTNYGNFMLVPWDEKLEYGKIGHNGGPAGEFYDGKSDFRFNGALGKHAVVRADLDPWQQHFINVATAASITGWVRAYLWRFLDASTNPAYCDTDCIMAESFPADMPLGEGLGEWAHEGVAHEAWIAGKKLYCLKGEFEKGKTVKMAAKGVRPDARKIKAAALGRVVTARSAAPTFSLVGKRPVYFQERRIRMTGD